MDENTKASLRKVIDYLYEDEKRHWVESEHPVVHIFHDLQRLDHWLWELDRK